MDTLKVYESMLGDFFSRCAQAKAIGIPVSDVYAGRDVPDGWSLDEAVGYFLPPASQRVPRALLE